MRRTTPMKYMTITQNPTNRTVRQILPQVVISGGASRHNWKRKESYNHLRVGNSLGWSSRALSLQYLLLRFLIPSYIQKHTNKNKIPPDTQTFQSPPLWPQIQPEGWSAKNTFMENKASIFPIHISRIDKKFNISVYQCEPEFPASIIAWSWRQIGQLLNGFSTRRSDLRLAVRLSPDVIPFI